MKRCPFCAEEIQDAAIVCRHCGRDLPTAAPSTAVMQQPPKSSQRKWVALGVVGVLGLLVLLALVGVFFPTPTPGRAPTVAAPTTTTATGSRRNPTATQLARLVESADEKCPSATRIFFQGVDATSETWNVQCSTGESFATRLNDSGEVKVLSCKMLKLVSKLDCFKTFDEQR